MTLTLEKVGQAIGEYSSSLINYGLFLTGNEEKSQKLAYKALLKLTRISDSELFFDRRAILFKTIRAEALKSKKLKKVSELEKEVLFLQLCENFSREEIKTVVDLKGDYWDQPYQFFLRRLQREYKIMSLDRTKDFFLVKHSKQKPHYLDDYYRNLLIDYVCDYKVELSARGMLVIAALMASLVIGFHHYDKWRDSQIWNNMMAPMYDKQKAIEAANRNIDHLFFGESVSPSNQLLTPFPDIQRPTSTEQSRACSLESQ